MRRFALPLLAALALLAGCAAEPAAAPPSADEAALPPIPFCRDEMVAFVELTRLARAHGEGWTVFKPAIDALQRRIVDCVDDTSTRLRELKLSPAPPQPPTPALRTVANAPAARLSAMR
ncbi:MAG TPA: hypothetical protein VN668_00020 [Stellaceae bacterium]|nr:hypothetical protein [Stellaceae bacterium]